MAKNIENTLIDLNNVCLARLTLDEKEEYTDFLMEAYKDQFSSYMFQDARAVQGRWLWKYFDNPSPISEKPLIWLCRIYGKIAGQFCLMPVEVKIKDRVYNGGWCQDFIVLSKYRARGLGKLIVKHAMDKAGAYIDILLVAGTNAASYAIFKDLGFSDVGFIGRNLKIINPQNVSSKFVKNRFLKSLANIAIKTCFKPHVRSHSMDRVRILEVTDFKAGIDNFCTAMSNKFTCRVKRDSAFLCWRFKNQPLGRYRILVAKEDGSVKGYAVIRQSEIRQGRFKGMPMGVVSDIFFDPEDAGIGAFLLSEAEKLLSGSDIIRCDMMSEWPDKFISKAGFRRVRSNNRFLVYPIKDELKGASLHGRPIDAWTLTYGDSDLDML